jgi:hypothetical protein
MAEVRDFEYAVTRLQYDAFDYLGNQPPGRAKKSESERVRERERGGGGDEGEGERERGRKGEREREGEGEGEGRGWGLVSGYKQRMYIPHIRIAPSRVGYAG